MIKMAENLTLELHFYHNNCEFDLIFDFFLLNLNHLSGTGTLTRKGVTQNKPKTPNFKSHLRHQKAYIIVDSFQPQICRLVPKYV